MPRPKSACACFLRYFPRSTRTRSRSLHASCTNTEKRTELPLPVRRGPSQKLCCTAKCNIPIRQPVGWVERSDTHQRRCVWRWVSLRSTHPTKTRLRDLAALIARGLTFVWPSSQNRGRREDRVLAAPAVSRAICANKTAHEHTGQREHSGLPCATALRLTSCSPRRTALLPPSSRRYFCAT